MKDSKQCNNIGEIREALDEIDFQIIELLGKRLSFVEEIVKFKKNEEEIIAKNRQIEVIEQRRNWAEQHKLDPDLIERIYSLIIQSNIQRELKLLKST